MSAFSTLSVVIPVYDAADLVCASIRSVVAWLSAQSYAWELIIVDDGSSDATLQRARQEAARSPGVRVIGGAAHLGKGACLARGFAEARGEMIAFLDVDLAYPPHELGRIVAALQGGADVAIACRMLAGSRLVANPELLGRLYARHLMGRLFNRIVRTVLMPGVLDTQAGLKGLRRAAASALLPQLTLHRFSFDVELLFLALRMGYRVGQVPVNFYCINDRTTVGFLDAVKMVLDIVWVRFNAWRGGYALPARDAPAAQKRPSIPPHPQSKPSDQRVAVFL